MAQAIIITNARQPGVEKNSLQLASSWRGSVAVGLRRWLDSPSSHALAARRCRCSPPARQRCRPAGQRQQPAAQQRCHHGNHGDRAAHPAHHLQAASALEQSRTMARETTTPDAAPAPCSTRRPISHSMPGDSAQPMPAKEPWKTIYGAAHGVDLPFIFGDFDRLQFYSGGFSTQNRPGRVALSDALQKSIAAFVRTGDPNNSSLGTFWPKATPGTDGSLRS